MMRTAGFEQAMQRAGLEVAAAIRPATPNARVFDEVCAALTGPERPTAMVVQGTQVLLSALNAIARMGLRVPEDVSIIAVGDSALSEDHVPAITALRLDRDALVDRIANRVLARIRGEVRGHEDSELAYTLVERASCVRLG